MNCDLKCNILHITRCALQGVHMGTSQLYFEIPWLIIEVG